MTQIGKPARIVLARHADTEWSVSGQHTGRTDIPLTESGRRAAEWIRARLEAQRFARVMTSPLERAYETARIAGFADRAEVLPELMEWDYGEFEGLTAPQIKALQDGWELWRDGAPRGETPAEVQARVDRIVANLLESEEEGDVLIFGHGHLLRALAVRWIGLPIGAGRLFRLDTGTISTLGWKRETRVIDVWNDAWHMQGEG